MNKRCQKCGIWDDDPSIPYNDPKSICYTFVAGYPEPDGEHEWKEELRCTCLPLPEPVDENCPIHTDVFAKLPF